MVPSGDALTADQGRRLEAIGRRWCAGADEFLRGPEATDQAACDAHRRHAAAEVREEVESLLTPKQLATLKEIVFRYVAVDALADPRVQRRIALSAQQMSALRQIDKKAAGNAREIEASFREKGRGVITAKRRARLFEELDRRGWDE